MVCLAQLHFLFRGWLVLSSTMHQGSSTYASPGCAATSWLGNSYASPRSLERPLSVCGSHFLDGFLDPRRRRSQEVDETVN
ncbi:hypothetical protein C8Q79DRAFT_950917, partial [Trametes meyenii]